MKDLIRLIVYLFGIAGSIIVTVMFWPTILGVCVAVFLWDGSCFAQPGPMESAKRHVMYGVGIMIVCSGIVVFGLVALYWWHTWLFSVVP